jgi:hypothetical protein
VKKVIAKRRVSAHRHQRTRDVPWTGVERHTAVIDGSTAV